MLNRIKKLIRLARISGSGKDDKQLPMQQVEYMGKVGNGVMLFPYGMHGNIPVDTLALMVTPNADSASRVGVAVAPEDRPTMAADEFCLYHPKTQSIIHFRSENGNLDIDVVKEEAGNVNINTTQANITASDSVNITAPDTIINGDFTVNGDTALGANVTSNGADISNTHGHVQANDSDGDTQAAISGVT